MSRVLAVLGPAIAFVASGCGFEPLPPDEPRSSELRDRPGVFSGESGTFVWRGGRRSEQDETEDDAPPADDQN